MARDPDRETEPAARDPGEEGTPPDAGTSGTDLTDESATWAAVPPGAGGTEAGTTPVASPGARRRPRPAPQRSEVSPARARGFAVAAWVWVAAFALALGLGILIAVFVV